MTRKSELIKQIKEALSNADDKSEYYFAADGIFYRADQMDIHSLTPLPQAQGIKRSMEEGSECYELSNITIFFN